MYNLFNKSVFDFQNGNNWIILSIKIIFKKIF